MQRRIILLFNESVTAYRRSGVLPFGEHTRYCGFGKAFAITKDLRKNEEFVEENVTCRIVRLDAETFVV
jgi:hypothetical protein